MLCGLACGSLIVNFAVHFMIVCEGCERGEEKEGERKREDKRETSQV